METPKTTLEQIINWLQGEIDNTDMTPEIAEDNDDFLMAGRRECAESLLSYIEEIEIGIDIGIVKALLEEQSK